MCSGSRSSLSPYGGCVYRKSFYSDSSRINSSTNYSARNDHTIATTLVRQGDLGTTRNLNTTTTSDMVLLRWQPPQHLCFKCDVDALFSDQFNKTSIDICISTMTKVPLCYLKQSLSLSVSISLSLSPHVLCCCGRGSGLIPRLTKVRDIQFDNVDFTLDSKFTTDAFHHCQVDVIKFGQMLSTYRSLFNTHFSNSKVEFNMRQVNEVAHTLAGVATLSTQLFKRTYQFKCTSNQHAHKPD
jgi:hypothetical protein